jgi:uncharacterized protein (TIGR02594 family)
MNKPQWLVEAYKMIGLHEAPGAADNPAVVQLFKEAGHPEVVHDATAWCAAFVGAMLHRAGVKGTGSLWALDYSKWGHALDGPALGAVATKKRFDEKGRLVGGHVFFVAGWEGDIVYGLGGNQSDQVSINKYPRKVVSAFRWPSDLELPTERPIALLPDAAAQAPGKEG